MANQDAIIKAALMTKGLNGRWGLPICFEGEPGIGKSSRMGQVARALDLHLHVLTVLLYEPPDIGGFNVPHEDEYGQLVMRKAPVSWATDLPERSIVFLDEINQGPPAMQGACMRPVLEGMVGDYALPNTVRFMAAQNAVEDSAGGYDLATNFANRWGHLPWGAPSPEEWRAYMIQGVKRAGAGKGPVISAEELEAEVDAKWGPAFAKARGLATGFTMVHADLLHKKPKLGNPQASKAWPSPRTWSMSTRALASANIHGLGATDREVLFGAFVGQHAAGEFFEWLAKADLPDPADVLDGKVPFEHKVSRPDRTAAVLDSCTALVLPKKAERRVERAARLWEILGSLAAKGADLAVVPARALTEADEAVAYMDEADAALSKLGPVVNTALKGS